MLIHYVGDIHQPLHAVTRITQDRPDGDKGGNLFKVNEHKGIKNLHAIWDSVIYTKIGYEDLPYTDKGWKDQGEYVALIRDKYEKEIDGSSLDVYDWAHESLDLAKYHVYNLNENDYIS